LFNGNPGYGAYFSYDTHKYEWNYMYSGYSFDEKKTINFIRFSDSYEESNLTKNQYFTNRYFLFVRSSKFYKAFNGFINKIKVLFG